MTPGDSRETLGDSSETPVTPGDSRVTRSDSDPRPPAGLRCRECKYKCHRHCEEQVPPSCGLPRKYVDFFIDQVNSQVSRTGWRSKGRTGALGRLGAGADGGRAVRGVCSAEMAVSTCVHRRDQRQSARTALVGLSGASPLSSAASVLVCPCSRVFLCVWGPRAVACGPCGDRARCGLSAAVRRSVAGECVAAGGRQAPEEESELGLPAPQAAARLHQLQQLEHQHTGLPGGAGRPRRVMTRGAPERAPVVCESCTVWWDLQLGAYVHCMGWVHERDGMMSSGKHVLC